MSVGCLHLHCFIDLPLISLAFSSVRLKYLIMVTDEQKEPELQKFISLRLALYPGVVPLNFGHLPCSIAILEYRKP